MAPRLTTFFFARADTVELTAMGNSADTTSGVDSVACTRIRNVALASMVNGMPTAPSAPVMPEATSTQLPESDL